MYLVTPNFWRAYPFIAKDYNSSSIIIQIRLLVVEGLTFCICRIVNGAS